MRLKYNSNVYEVNMNEMFERGKHLIEAGMPDYYVVSALKASLRETMFQKTFRTNQIKNTINAYDRIESIGIEFHKYLRTYEKFIG